MCITEYDEQVFVNGIKEEAREEGIDIGEKKMIYKYVSSGRISLSEGADDAGMSIDELKEAMSKAGYKVPEMA